MISSISYAFWIAFIPLLLIFVISGLRTQRARATVASTVLVIGGLFAIIATIVAVKGSPLPYNLWVFKAPEIRVLSYKLEEPKAIYYWLRTGRDQQPIYVVRPWDSKEAEGLRKAMEEAKKQGQSEVEADFSGGRSGGDGGDTTPSFFPTPIKELPPKNEFNG